MDKNKTYKTQINIVFVILGTLLGGFLWRCRGESGFGSSWGMYSVGLVLLLLIWVFYGDKKGMKFEKILLGSFLAGLGVTGYATVIDQMGGVLWSDLPYKGEVIYAPIDASSGAAIILIMGFTMVPFLAFFIGSLFSDKEYTLKDYIIMVAVFFGVSYLMKATIAHPILKLINPEQYQYALLGLKDSGYDYSSPMKAYMLHFGQRKWSQEIPFNENYYMSIEHISDAFGVLTIALYPLIKYKDKIVCASTLIISAFTSIVTTVMSFMISISFNPHIFGIKEVPSFLDSGEGWGLWEFSTGAAVGFITALFIALLPEKYKKQTGPDNTPFLKNQTAGFIFTFISVVWTLCLTPWRAAGIRFAKLLTNEGIIENDDTLGTIIMICGTVISALIWLFVLKNNNFRLGKASLNITPYVFSLKALPAYYLLCFVLYFFGNHGYAFHLPYKQFTGFKETFNILTAGYPEFTLMSIAFILTILCAAAAKKAVKKAHREFN